MAEFKLGRLRFVWQGTWTTSHNYVKDDVISYGSNTYVCLTGHTSANTNVGFNSDLSASNWQLMSSGIHWISAGWSTSTTYAVGDIVKIGAKEYICTAGHVSSATPNTGFYSDLSSNNWSLLVDGTEWESTWTKNIFYNLNDIVKVGGKEYICILQHLSTNVDNSGFYTDLTASKWSLYSDGIAWSSDWTTSHFYNLGDIVKFGAKDFICTTAHTSNNTVNSGFYSDSSNWQLLVDGLAWQNTWQYTTYYKIGDVVKYGAKNYICVIGHTSSTSTPGGFYNDVGNSYWQLYSDGIQWLGTWSSGTNYYNIGDVVVYGSIVYVCNNGHAPQPTLEASIAYWTVFTKGFNWIGVYTNGPTTYKLNDVVRYGADLYICTIAAGYTTSSATIDLSKWSLFVAGLEYQSTYSAGTSYALGDVVTYGGYVYSSKSTNNIGHTPSTATTFWDVVTTGFNTRGAWSSGASPTYKTGDVITYGGYVYVAILDNANTNPASDTSSWSLLNTGIYWAGAWTGAVSYKLGDAVSYASNSYICILAHTAGYTGGSPPATGTNNRPDVDTSGIYWNALAQGAATNVTTTRGDMIYYSAVGNARLPIGTDGQVLKVVGSDPVWSTYGVINNIYYVAPNGTDATGYGSSIDKPWKTIAYACTQVKNGPANPNAQTQLLNNKNFLAAEVDNYLTYTYKASVTGTSGSAFLTASTAGLTVGMPIRFANLTGSLTLSAVALNTSTTYYVSAITLNTSFTVAATYLGTAGPAAGTGTGTAKFYYDSAKTVRDTKDLLDGFIFDIGRGGNVETVVNAGTYFSGETTFASTGITQQVNQFVAGLTYLSTIVANIIAKTTPSSNYQTLNSVGSPVTQSTSGSVGEAGTTTTVQTLITIVTGALNAGTTLAIPAMSQPNTTVYIKTGTYSEILPISVPAFTSLIGDELRVTVVQPYTFTVTSSGSTGSGSSTMVLTSASGIVYGAQYTGMGIYGNKFIPDGTYITNVATNTITLSTPTTGIIPTGTVLTVGYSMSHMFYMRDGTVARNMTVKGLYGGLGTANGYGTKRPTSGAYFSLDPGTGTTDETVWINSRSPYMQNITLLGTGCVGMKVDGSLHGGGNKSIVANDFTNVLSDGIAVWCLNLAKVEAVSVFSYYGYAGYLSELGGAIRATNGNSSYGTYGCVAEAGNPSEVAITGTVNTHATQALITNTLLGGGQVLWLEYSNAGQTYTTATYTVTSSSGVGAVTSTPNIYSNAIAEIRIITAGSGYVSAVNNAQTGNNTTLTVSAADIANTASYNGMRIVLTDGTGAGQYGFIAYNNGGTKVANICKESFVALTTSSCTSTVFNVSSTSTIPVGTPIVFSGTTFGGVTVLSQIYYVISSNFTGTAFSVSTSLGGSIVSLTPASGTMTIYQAGWDVAVSGTTVITTLDFTTRYIIEPRVTFTNTSGTGALVRAKVLSGSMTEFRVINPGTGYITPITVTATATTNNQITATNTLVANQTVIFTSSFNGIVANTYYYVSSSNLSGSGFSVTTTPGGSTVTISATGAVSASGSAQPAIVITDPNVSSAATLTVRAQASGVLGQPNWTSRGSSYKDASAIVATGDGYADVQPVGYFVYLAGLASIPVAGSNLVFQNNAVYYTLVQTLSTSGTVGNYGAYVQVNPAFTATNAPVHSSTVTATIQYSQVRLTGHDFLYVGSGNFGATGYPNNFSTANRIQVNETVNSAGGRVFFTSTDQDGNFRVGGLFTVQQATGVATLNANLFNLSGLNALQFASGGASVTQFSTDATFSANSDSIVPTQRAVKSYLASQLGAGGAVLAVSSLTSGNIIINGNTITTQNAVDLNITAVAGKTVQLNTLTNLNSTTTLTSGGSLTVQTGATITLQSGSLATVAAGSTLTLNGTTTVNTTPTVATDVVNKKYADRTLSLNTMWTNAW